LRHRIGDAHEHHRHGAGGFPITVRPAVEATRITSGISPINCAA
jgi:hypothetical protein